MPQAILTKYIAPTTHKGARVKATAYAGSVTVPWDYALSCEGNHDAAARALCVKMGWKGNLYSGSLPDDSGNAYVFNPDISYAG